jgi:hypothetical protein
MSMTSQWYEKRVSRIAYELADASRTGPTPEARSEFEERVWDAFERHDGILERLEKRLGLDSWSNDVVHIADVEASGLEGIAAAIMGALSEAIAARAPAARACA